MSTRANVLVKYEDRMIGAPSELFLYHHFDGNVQGIGEMVTLAVHACGQYIYDGSGLKGLWDHFPLEFEDTAGLQPDIEFLYRITYAGAGVTIVARHGGYVGECAEEHYRHINDTPFNSIELYRAAFVGAGVGPLSRESFSYDIREPESYVCTLVESAQPAVRAWRGRLR